MSKPLLDRTTMIQAFELLADHLRRRRVVGEVHIVGGAAMVLAFGARRATRDIDALYEPDTAVRESAWEVADQLGLPRSWLNNQASVYISAKATPGTAVFNHPNLRVMVTRAEHLLAMKVRAARPASDAGDIRRLIDHLAIASVDQVLAIVARYFDEPLSERSRLLLEDVIAEASSTQARECGAWMPRARRRCSRPRDHRGAHR